MFPRLSPPRSRTSIVDVSHRRVNRRHSPNTPPFSQSPQTIRRHLPYQNSTESELFGDAAMSSSGLPQTVLLGFVERDHNQLPTHKSSSASGSFGSELLVPEDANLDRAICESQLIRSQSLFDEGILLKCVETNASYPYLHYAVFNEDEHVNRLAQINHLIRTMNTRPGCQYGAYDEVFSIQRSTTIPENRLPVDRHAGFIAICFKILEDGVNHGGLEKTWLSWSGAREVYKYSPRPWNLRRIVLHRCAIRSGDAQPFAYVLLCEFGNIFHPSNRLQALDMCERLRVRNCGYTTLFQVQWGYGSAASDCLQPSSSSASRREGRNPMTRGFSHDVEMPPVEPVRRRAPLLRYRDRSLGYGLEDR